VRAQARNFILGERLRVQAWAERRLNQNGIDRGRLWSHHPCLELLLGGDIIRDAMLASDLRPKRRLP
jgi:hypothetical protein